MITKKLKEFSQNIYNVEYEAYLENGLLYLNIKSIENNIEFEYHLYDGSLLESKIEPTEKRNIKFKLNKFGNYRVKVFIKGKKGVYSFFTEFLNFNEITSLKYLNKNKESFNDGVNSLSKMNFNIEKSKKDMENLIEKIHSVQALDYNISKYFIENNIKEISIFGYKNEKILSKLIWINFRYCKDIKIKKLLSNTPFLCEINTPRKIEVKFEKINSNDNFDKDDIIIVCSSKKSEKEIDIIQEKVKAKVIHISELINKIIIEQSIINPIKKLKQQYKDANFIVCTLPNITKVKNKSENEMEIIKENINLKDIRLNLSTKKITIPPALKRFNKNIEYNKEVMKPYYLTEKNKIHLIEDINSEYVNVVNNFRLTTNQPIEYNNTIYLFGNSVTFGLGSSDDNTISSFLQRIINDNNFKYRVVNYSNHASNDYDYQFELMNSINFKPNDIIVSIVSVNIRSDEDYIINRTQELFDRPHKNGEIFIDKTHINKIGNEIIAKSLYETMTKNNLLFNNNTKNSYDIDIKENFISNELYDELIRYREILKNYKVNKEKIGAIVMNCNPFTLGHKHLIEYAAKKVDHLYVFVVEEDKSFFTFKDRFMLVKKGTKNIDNITILPSGKFIISSLTFSDYFNKEKINEKTLNISDDVILFAKEIAPILNIKKRFVGEEPLCNVTKQYNNTLFQLLPQFGIDLEIIPRICYKDEPISASRVRKLLKEENFEEIKKLVPKTTFNYLIKNYK